MFYEVFVRGLGSNPQSEELKEWLTTKEVPDLRKVKLLKVSKQSEVLSGNAILKFSTESAMKKCLALTG